MVSEKFETLEEWEEVLSYRSKPLSPEVQASLPANSLAFGRSLSFNTQQQ